MGSKQLLKGLGEHLVVCCHDKQTLVCCCLMIRNYLDGWLLAKGKQSPIGNHWFSLA
jgi:hypothetical protein